MARYGHLDMLVGDWGLVAPYWQESLKDFPEHPASANPGLSVPCTLYCAWDSK